MSSGDKDEPVRLDFADVLTMSRVGSVSASRIVKGSGSPLGVCVASFDDLRRTVASVVGDSVKVRVSGQSLVMTGRSKATLTMLPPDSANIIRPMPESCCTMLASEWARGVDQTVFAVASEDSRYGLNGLHIEHHNGMTRFVATDGHRLAVSDAAAISGSVDLRNRRTVLPAQLAKAIGALGGQIDIAIDQGWIYARSESGLVAGPMLDCEFPDYNAIIPTGYAWSARLPRKVFVDAIKACAASGIGGVSASLVIDVGDGVVALSMSNGDRQWTMDVEAVTDGRMKLGADLRYVSESVARLGCDGLLFQGNSGIAPVRVSAADETPAFGIVMPRRLS